jgi:hypothetical protein
MQPNANPALPSVTTLKWLASIFNVGIQPKHQFHIGLVG